MTDEERAAAFAEMTTDLVLAHKDHGGWYETEEGLRCQADDELVLPAAGWLESS